MGHRAGHSGAFLLHRVAHPALTQSGHVGIVRRLKNRGGVVVNCNTGGAHCGGGVLAGDAWKFLQAHPFGVDPDPYAGGLPADFSSQCMLF